MTTENEFAHEHPPSLKIVPTIYPTSPSLEDVVDRFWRTGPEFHADRVVLFGSYAGAAPTDDGERCRPNFGVSA